MSDLIKNKILPEDYYPHYDLSFKILFQGDTVGKTQILNQVIKGTYEDFSSPTIGYEFFAFNIKLENKVIHLLIWDTNSLEQYQYLIKEFYQNSNLNVILYSIENSESFLHVKNWLNIAKKYCPKDCKFFLIGNKIDLESERKITRVEAEKFAKENNFDFFDECSAKLGINTENILIQAAKILSYPSFKEKLKKYISH